MQVILLCAGVGKRLAPYTEARPKCLMEVGERTLLERHLIHVRRLGARGVTVVVGHLREQVEAELSRLAPSLPVDAAFNPEYRQGSIVSLRTGLAGVDDDLIFMDTDVLYHPEVLGRLFGSAHPCCALIDGTSVESGEEMMIGVREGSARVIARRIAHLGRFDERGESVGFFRISRDHLHLLRSAIDETIETRGPNLEYEDALNLVFERAPVGVERVDGLPWTEIDFAEDLRRAREEVAPLLPPLDPPPLDRQASRSKGAAGWGGS